MINNKNKSVSLPAQQVSEKQHNHKKNPAELLINIYIHQCYEDGGITLVNLRHLAHLLGIKNHDTFDSEAELVKAIQKAVQNRTCFRSDQSENCPETDCQWKTECKKIIAEWLR